MFGFDKGKKFGNAGFEFAGNGIRMNNVEECGIIPITVFGHPVPHKPSTTLLVAVLAGQIHKRFVFVQDAITQISGAIVFFKLKLDNTMIPTFRA